MLGNPACFSGGDFCMADEIERCRFPMVNMAHNGDNRRADFEVFFTVFRKIRFKIRLVNDHFFFHFNTVFRSNQFNGIFVKLLVDRCHNAEQEQFFNDFGRFSVELLRKFRNGQRFCERNFFRQFFYLLDRLRLRFEVFIFPVIFLLFVERPSIVAAVSVAAVSVIPVAPAVSAVPAIPVVARGLAVSVIPVITCGLAVSVIPVVACGLAVPVIPVVAARAVIAARSAPPIAAVAAASTVIAIISTVSAVPLVFAVLAVSVCPVLAGSVILLLVFVPGAVFRFVSLPVPIFGPGTSFFSGRTVLPVFLAILLFVAAVNRIQLPYCFPIDH